MKETRKKCKSLSAEPSITKFWKPKNSRHVVYSFTSHAPFFVLVVGGHAPFSFFAPPPHAPSVQCCRVPPPDN